MTFDPDRSAPARLPPLLPSMSPVGPAEPGGAGGRLLAMVLLIVLAFGLGFAVDRASTIANDNGSGSGSSATAAPNPPSGAVTTAHPGATSGTSGGPSGSGALASPVVTPGPTIGPGATVPPYAPANIGLLWDALKLIEDHYVRRSQLNPTDLTYGAINGLVESLGDPGHTVFLTPAEVKSENDALSGTISGIGVFLGQEGGAPVIVSVVSGSPASKAGLLSGDLLIAVNGMNAQSLTLSAIAALVRGPAGTTVTLTIIHPHSATPIDVTIVRAQITVPAVDWTMVPGTTIADVQISQFSAGAGDELITALRAVRQAGATAIILDLRNNPGGFVGEAVTATSQFLKSGNVYIRELADGQRIPVPVQAGGIATNIPIAVLVDFGTASSGEIMAGALQDAKRGPIIGVRTYGTGTVLNTYPLPDGSALRIGVEEWLTPSGRHIFPDGITPDITVDLPPDTRPVDPETLHSMTAAALAASGDSQLLKAVQTLQGK
ncbi:MAG TPA: S41 family peptidase [Candidatus Saccharimonadales bacterium]|nr:S41 family peptidase [Candidatus Saccharimonadales bacterium]